MQGLMNWFTRIFGTMFRTSWRRYIRRFRSRVRYKTLGRAQANMHRKRSEMDKKVFSAQDRVLGDKKKR